MSGIKLQSDKGGTVFCRHRKTYSLTLIKKSSNGLSKTSASFLAMDSFRVPFAYSIRFRVRGEICARSETASMVHLQDLRNWFKSFVHMKIFRSAICDFPSFVLISDIKISYIPVKIHANILRRKIDGIRCGTRRSTEFNPSQDS